MYLLAPLEDAATERGFALPLLCVPGNHDPMARMRVYIRPPRCDASGAAQLPGCEAWSLIAWSPLVSLLALDTIAAPPQQAAWLRGVCDARRRGCNAATDDRAACAPHLVVLSHIPPFIDFWEPQAWFQRGEAQWPRYAQSLLPEVAACAPTAWLGGHSHIYQRGVLPFASGKWHPTPDPDDAAQPGAGVGSAPAATPAPRPPRPDGIPARAAHGAIFAIVGGGGGELEADIARGDAQAARVVPVERSIFVPVRDGPTGITTHAHHFALVQVGRAGAGGQLTMRVWDANGVGMDAVTAAQGPWVWDVSLPGGVAAGGGAGWVAPQPPPAAGVQRP
jgi:hypothetical protein